MPLFCFKSLAPRFGRRTRKQESEKAQNQDHTISGSQNAATQALPPLNSVILPQVLPEYQFNLGVQGWTTMMPSEKLYSSYQALLEASQTFFDLPEAHKQAFRTKQGSEDGWNCVEGEKEFITLRTLDRTPEGLREAASRYWAEAGSLLNDMLGRIAESLGLPHDLFTVYSKPCVSLSEDQTQSMLRLFRYEGFEGQQSKIVAEAHRDLGLLSLVISDTPGLEVWSCQKQSWFPLERMYSSPAGSLLVGRQLETLSNGRYRSGGHLVRSYPDAPQAPDQVTASSRSRGPYRYSVVFVLRAHSPIPVDTDQLTTRITGKFSKPLNGITAGELFKNIQAAHFNINTGMDERDEQKRKLAEKKKTLSSNVQ